MNTWSGALAVVALALASFGAAEAQNFPSRPLRMIVPQPAGGTMDSNARAIAPALERTLGHNVVVDNRSGANGIIAGELLAKAPPDGHTLLYTSNSIINNQLVQKKPSFDVLRDFEPVTNIGNLPGYLVLVNTQVPAQSMKELIELSRSARDPVRFGSGGIGNSQHLLGELINLKGGSRMMHVPYKGFAPMITALLGNEVQVAFGAPTTVLPHVKAGRLRVLGYTAEKRWSGLPSVPTIGESIPGFVFEAAWHGVFAPARTPRPVLVRIQEELAKAIREPRIREYLEAGGYVPVGDSPESFRRFVAQELKTIGDLMKLANVKPE